MIKIYEDSIQEKQDALSKTPKGLELNFFLNSNIIKICEDCNQEKQDTLSETSKGLEQNFKID